MEIRITDQKGPALPKEFMGLFFEDINYAADGGIYAEMLENRDFESLDVYGADGMDYYAKQDSLYAWSTYPHGSGATLEAVQASPLYETSPHYARLTVAGRPCGMVNKAYDGIYMRPGVGYRIKFYARRVRGTDQVTVAVVKDGTALVRQTVELKKHTDGWNRWERYELRLQADTEIQGAGFALLLEQPGTVELDHFSMMPEDAVYGVFRKDLADLLRELHPGFLRFPGGCIVEGATLANRYRFQDTLGVPEARRHNWNRWALHGNSDKTGFHSKYSHYGQTYGLGFYEYFLLCEYIGAKPLPVLGVGLACQYQSLERVEPDDPAIQAYIQDYLDLIEFANGDASTPFGAIRAEMGHPEPFHLEMVGVGNEQWEDATSRFFERYQLFEKEIHKVHPEIRLVGTAGPELDSPRFHAAWDFYRAHAGQKDFVYAVDEHYYKQPQWFLEHTHYFDSIPRDIKVFFGEYAAHPETDAPFAMNRCERNNLESALAEAAFLTGMARNSDVVAMTCYAPLFARLGYAQWTPDLIWFNEAKAYCTPNYYVQQLFAHNLGDYNILVDETTLPCQASYDESAGELVVMLVNALPETQDIQLTLAEGWREVDAPVTELLLTGTLLSSWNSIEEETVKPVRREIKLTSPYALPAFSLAVLRIPAKHS